MEWLIEVGDNFSEGQEICEIESSKIVNVLEAPYSGTLRKIIAGPGETLPVQAPIAVAAPTSIADADVEAFAAELGGVTAIAASIQEDAGAEPKASTSGPVKARIHHAAIVELPVSGAVDIPAGLADGGDDSSIHATPRARVLAAQHCVNLNNVTGTGRNGRVSICDIRQAVGDAGGHLPGPRQFLSESLPDPTTQADDSSVAATPLARRLAANLGINLHDCRASGRNGRVVKTDVEAAHLRLHGAQQGSVAPTSPEIEPLPPTGHAFVDSTMSGMRKTIAARLQTSKQTAPHYRLTIDCRLDPLLALRKQINSDNPAAKVSVNDFLVKAAAMALIDVPECNIQYNGEVLRQFEDAHVAVAVALDSGLITPIVQAANTKGLIEISNETTSLVTRAKAGTLQAEDFQGGTFTVSNLGMFGIKQFDAIINPPQAAILAVGAGEKRVVVENGEPATAILVTVTLSSDHRVIDGALGARWLQSFREFVEQPARLLS